MFALSALTVNTHGALAFQLPPVVANVLIVMLLKPVVCPIEKLAKVKNNKNKIENFKRLPKHAQLLFTETSFR
jgi:hypothetical protein